MELAKPKLKYGLLQILRSSEAIAGGIMIATHAVAAMSYKYVENGRLIKTVRNKLLTLTP